VQPLRLRVDQESSEDGTEAMSAVSLSILEQGKSQGARERFPMRTGRPPKLKECHGCKQVLSARQMHAHRCPAKNKNGTKYYPGDALKDFVRLVSVDTEDCIHFAHSLTCGRGIINYQGKNYRARALAWNLTYPNNPVPKGVFIRQSCGSKDCINPKHLSLESRWCPQGKGLEFIQDAIRANTEDCIRWPYVHSGGYGRIKHKRRQWATHVLAWMLANGKSVPPGICVCHRCDVRDCINPKHLFIGTGEDNRRDMINKRRHVFGEKHPSAKLTADQVLTIRDSTNLNTVQASKEFGITKSSVSKIRLRKTWKLLD
jgi:hypothetical protein